MHSILWNLKECKHIHTTFEDKYEGVTLEWCNDCGKVIVRWNTASVEKWFAKAKSEVIDGQSNQRAAISNSG